MIDPKVIEKCQKIANDKKVKNLPKYFDISEFLFSNRFSGDRFLSLDAKNVVKFDKTIGYVYKNTILNVEVVLFYNKVRNSTNASIYFKDYDIKIERLSLKKLVEIIRLINS